MLTSEMAAANIIPRTDVPAVLESNTSDTPGIYPPAAGYPSHLDKSPEKGVLVLQDGTILSGYSCGALKNAAGECVFQTGMCGYPESLTDPSYSGQILVLTFPLIGNYGVPPRNEVNDYIEKVLAYFESSKIHIAALLIGNYSFDYSHYLATSSLEDWLKENNVPALFGIDTRMLTKKIRTQGVLLGKVLFKKSVVGDGSIAQDVEAITEYSNIPFVDPNGTNLVEQVSTPSPKLFSPDSKSLKLGANGKPIRILAIDVGIKNNQIRCFMNRGVELKVVGWNYDFLKEKDYDGLFVSNGPGDPSMLTTTIARLSEKLKRADTPIFGICLGHQLMALAAGAKTIKMKFGNRGQNIPCTDMTTGRCYITSQNHGYAVDSTTLPEGWEEYFVNANDGSNEGIIHKTLPYFSVQFHPESEPGPLDAEFLFDRFIDSVLECNKAGKPVPLTRGEHVLENQRVHPRKVLILGSGGLSIGQAGEFDYSGSQAIKALKEEGIYTVLINPNIATIQTSKGLADKVYFLPVTPDFVRKVIKHERPDGIYCTFGGQTALNVGVKLKDEFEGLGVKVLGTSIETIEITEDRELFAQALNEIGEKSAQSASAINIQQAIDAAKEIGYPVITRAAYALGGLGSGFAENEHQLRELCSKAFATSPQVLIEKSMKGWKEIEYEVVRDINDNCITVCNMENFDPLGIHTGDSIVVAPSQTLSNDDYMMLRRTAVNVIRHLGVIGECNIQYALNPNSKEYCIIEVNARLSRSSALASKATGYPLAFVAAKLGLGIPLTEVKNSVTKKTIACFEPSLDYCIVKMPRWDLKKFNRVSTKISSSMKSVGEVMAIGRNFEEAIQKAIRSVEFNFLGFSENDFVDNIEDELVNPSDLRLFAIANALHKGYTVDKVWELTKIDKWFLNKLQNIVNIDKKIAEYTVETLPASLLLASKQIGFSDRMIATILSTTEMPIRKLRKSHNISPFIKQIDTVAAEFPCYTNYLYTTYNASEHDVTFGNQGVMVLGSGVYRIGSSVEFDWCAVRCIRTLREQGIPAIMVNYNPETVSTDYDEADRLYFETLTLETVLDIYEAETANGVVVSMGGQAPNNLALSLYRQNVNILGTSPERIDNAENRYKFSRMLDNIGVDQPEWKELSSINDAFEFCNKVGYPVLVRPSYVLSGAAMNTVYSEADLTSYLDLAVKVSPEYPVVISKFIEEAKEIEMDGVAHDGRLIMHVISEHVENAGVHSGDATLVLPPQDLDPSTVQKIEYATQQIADALNVTGPLNIQFIAKNNEIKVIECNVRASRSFPFCSKVLGVDLVSMATKAMINVPYTPYPRIDIPKDYVAVKVPQFSFSRLAGADPILGVEMASTGEVACFGKTKYDAYIKALLATGFTIPKKNILLSIGSFKEKQEFLPSVKRLHELGYVIFATTGTADFIQEHGIPVKYVEALPIDEKGANQKPEYSLIKHLQNNLIDLYINLPSKNRFRRPASYMSSGYRTRRMAVDFAVPLITNIKCAKLFVEALSRKTDFEISSVDYQTSHRVLTIPGLINVQNYYGDILSKNAAIAFKKASEDAIQGGLTLLCNTPHGSDALIDSYDDLTSVKESIKSSGTVLDYTTSFAATEDNLNAVAELTSRDVNSVYFGKSDLSFAAFSEQLKILKTQNPIVVVANESSLASSLYLASLHNKAIHVSDVKTKGDISLIALSKERGVQVTCDVNIWSLFANTISDDDKSALWDNFESIDCLSILKSPFVECSNDAKYAISLLLTAVSEKKLSIDDVLAKMHLNPRKIFNLPEQPQTYIELEVDRAIPLPEYLKEKVDAKELKGMVTRVVIRGSTVFLDNEFIDGAPFGKEILSVSAHNRKKSLISKTPVKFGEESPRNANTPVSALFEEDSNETISDEEESEKATKIATKEISTYRSKILDLFTSASSTALKQSPFYRRNVISVRQFTRQSLHTLFGIAQELRTMVERQGTVNIMKGRVVCLAFFEPSTRTCCSFDAAAVRLGAQVVKMDTHTSSVKKGENLADTVRTLGQYGDCIVMRHPDPGSALEASKYSPVPIINAGDGIGEHPTQAFLDVFTIREELGTVNGLTITVVGDLKNGRTVHSLVKLLTNYDGIKINYVAPESLRMPSDLKEEIAKSTIQQREYSSLDDVISTTDVLYVTRVQKERFSSEEEYEKIKNSYIITAKTLARAKRNMIVMHPLPRVGEITDEIDTDQRAAYFRQMKYGLYIRMALLALVLGQFDN